MIGPAPRDGRKIIALVRVETSAAVDCFAASIFWEDGWRMIDLENAPVAPAGGEVDIIAWLPLPAR